MSSPASDHQHSHSGDDGSTTGSSGHQGSNSNHGSSSAAGPGGGVKRQKVNHKPPPDALQHKFKPFVQAAFDMVSNPANSNAVRFNDDGTAVEIIDVSAFSDKVLPKYFKHKNISSFIRQMNMYGFEKIDGAEEAIHTFKHEYFKRDQPSLLAKILRKPVKAHRKGEKTDSDDGGDDHVHELVESTRAEALQAVDELARLKKVQAEHEERIMTLEEENSHLSEENQRIKGAIVQVKSAQAAMTDRLRRLFMYFMRYYVRDEKALEDTIRGLIDNVAAAGDSAIVLTDPQRQILNSLFQLKDAEEPDPNDLSLLRPAPEDELTKNHSLASPWDQPIMLPPKPKFDDSLNSPEYVSLARDLASHIDQNDQTLRRIDTLASELQDVVDPLADDFLEPNSLVPQGSLGGLLPGLSFSGPLELEELSSNPRGKSFDPSSSLLASSSFDGLSASNNVPSSSSISSTMVTGGNSSDPDQLTRS